MELFHIATRAAWDAARTAGVYARGDAPFIHLSTAAQWPGVLSRFFAGQTDLVLLVIDGAGLDIRFEPVEGDRFPHLYGDLPIASVTAVNDLPLP